jgi:hypothetical protein
VRLDLRTRLDRARGRLGVGVLGQLAQTAIAAGIAWELALQLPNHGRPFFAPIAAAIALGAERGRRGRQAIEMMTGVALGILVGAVLLAVAGAGWWQIVVGTFVAILLATAAGAPPMIRNQAAASVILVVALHTPGSNLALQRLEDALIGGAVAIVLARFLFPIDPVALVRDEARVLRQSLAAALDEVAAALEAGDRRRADAALERVFALDDHRLMQALGVAREIVQKAPRRRRMRRRIDKLGELYRELEASLYDAHAIATGAVRLTDGSGPPPAEAAAAVAASADAVRAVEPDEARAAAESARAAARRLREADDSLGAGVVAHGAVGVAEHTLRAAEAREEERRLAESRRGRSPFR